MIESPSRIAIFRALYLGDFLLAVPAFRAIRRQFPEAEITLIGLPWSRELVRRFGHYLDRFVEFPGYPGIDEVPVVPERTARFLEEQRGQRYDLAIQMHGSGTTSNPLILDLGAKATAGCFEGARLDGLTFALPYSERELEVLRNLRLAEILGCSRLDTALEFPLFFEDRREARGLLEEHGGKHGRLRAQQDSDSRAPLVGIHAGSKDPNRRWPPDSFAALADLLADRLGARIVLTGGPGEEAVAHAIESRMRFASLNLAGKTSLGALGGIIADLDLLVSNDTGPAHLAEAVGTPTVRLFSIGDPARWGPLDRTSHVVIRAPMTVGNCRHRTSSPHHCPDSLSPDPVFDAAESLLTAKVVSCDV